MANDRRKPRKSWLWRGVPELLVLRLLQDQEMYGYEIVQAIAGATQDIVTPGEGVISPLLHALEKANGDLRAQPRPAGAGAPASITP